MMGRPIPLLVLLSAVLFPCLGPLQGSDTWADSEPRVDADVLPEWMRGKDLRATYNDGIALIVEHRCVGCHRPGEVAPMSFLGYNDIRKWAGRTNTPLESLIQTRAMPPWPADPAVGEFSNSLFLTQREMDLLITWIRNGLPRGEGTFKPTRQWVEGWNIGTPDHVFELPQHTIADTVDEELKEFDVLIDFPNDRWIVAAEARPGNESVVRSIEASPLGTYQPGNSHVLYAAGTGRLLKKGQNVRALVHYAKAKGLAASDQSKLAVVFARDSMPRKNILEHPMVAPEFTIPAGTANFEVQARFEFPADGQIISLMPVMNLRGKDVYYRAIFPDATAKPLLSIPAWDPNWKYCYQLKSPLAAPKGTIVQAVAHFDNSDANVRNPDPAVAVNSGIGGEVFEGWIGYWIAEQE